MGRRRKLLRVLKWTGLGTFALLIVWGLCALVLPRIAVNTGFRAAEQGGVTLYVLSNGVHADFVVPAVTPQMDWTEELPYADFEQADASFRWLSLGWGDRGFYLETPTWGDLKFSTAFKAMFFLSSAAVHVTWQRHPPADSEHRRVLRLTDEQYQRLVDYLRESFLRDDRGRPRRIDHAGYTPHDRFYEASGTYSFVTTCNEWAGAGLRRCGVKVGLWTPFVPDVLRYLER